MSTTKVDSALEGMPKRTASVASEPTGDPKRPKLEDDNSSQNPSSENEEEGGGADLSVVAGANMDSGFLDGSSSIPNTTSSLASPTPSPSSLPSSTPPPSLLILPTPPFSTYDVQQQTEALCVRTFQHSGLNWFYHDPIPEAVGNINPYEPLVGMNVQLSCRLRMPEFPPPLASGIMDVCVDWTERFRLGEEEDFFDEVLVHTLGWYEHGSGVSDAAIMNLLALSHRLFGEVVEVIEDDADRMVFAVRWDATIYCAHV
ncbi:hypothetical protein BJ508DRAFT_328059 [Ascobolus immersus RN42]|uniref:Uncharacterized protein n=1 Tax=Ascobolus immersus RN42 TaxID=1160509 RepID=A0A3N4I129_ASCIM|nr:hypothetical protein BJ508DRAFT_328059 [Ascobolus immersus RN42]